MAPVPVQFYEVTHFSEHPTIAAVITCLNVGSRVAFLTFMNDGVPLPANTIGPGTPNIHFPVSQLNNVITTLRYEKPLQVDLPSTLIGTVGTASLEPVGEQEGV
jgi:hypothetical protein